MRQAEIKRRKAEADAMLRQLELEQHRSTADSCWARRGYHCDLPREELFVFCKACTRFNPTNPRASIAVPPPIAFDEEDFPEAN